MSPTMKSQRAGIAVFMLACLAGCDRTPPRQRAERLAPLVVSDIRQRIGGDVAGIEDVHPGLGAIEVYVDRSLTLQPYDRSDASALGRLVGALEDFLASEVSFYGFGFPTHQATSQEIRPLHPQTIGQPGLYTYANNDYAALFRTFEHDGGTRIVLTDGVQSDPAGRARLGAVVDELHRWVTDGGAFAALIYRNAYRGQYYSDFQGDDPAYDCDDRPFVAFVLAPSARAVDELLARIGPGLRPQHIVRIGGNDLALRPIGETLPDSGERRGLRVARDVRETVIAGFKPIPSTVIVNRAGRGSGGYVPLQFEAALSLREHPWASLGPQGTARFARRLRPELHAWSFDERRLRADGDSTRRDSARRDRAAGDTAVRWVRLDARTPSIDSVRVSADSVHVRFTIPARRPPGRAHDFVFLVTLRPGEEGALELVPDTLSTDDDRSPDACGKVLKLRRLLGSIVLRNYVPGRTLLVADWR
jgi:hypothetical protein